MSLFRTAHHVHFMGIGGVGMSGIAEILVTLGHHVSGCDLKESDAVARLRRHGATVAIGHHPDHLADGDVDVVVTSSAIPADHPEIVAARAARIPVIPRAEMLAELMRLKYGVAVAGAHGKTSTTSILATLLEGAGLDPTVVVGGKVKGGSGARLGAGEVLVAEADESDGSFLSLSPVVAVVTNLDDEHLDHYGSPEAIDDAFVAFCNRVPFFGACVVNLDDPRLARLLPRLSKRTITYGTSPQAELRIIPSETPIGDGPQTFQLVEQGRDLGVFHLWAAGSHNVANATAAIGAARFLGAEVEPLRGALPAYTGVGRRFELLFDGGGIRLVDDYGHHPTEIDATLAAARATWSGRLVALVQPHRYTRLAALLDRFATSLLATDVCLITNVYAAGERRGSGPDGSDLTELLRLHGHRQASFHPDLAALERAALEVVRPGDLLVTLGAGDITRLAHHLAETLAAHHGAPRAV